MDYKEAYQETLQQLFFKTRELEAIERREEKNLIVLGQLEAVILQFDMSVDRLDGARKETALNTLKKLYFVFDHIGRIYLDELAARKKKFESDKLVLELLAKIGTIEKELEIERKIKEF